LKLIKLRNYYRHKFQRTGNNRSTLFRNILNNHVKAALIDGRNNYISKKLYLLNTKDKSLWNSLKSLRRKRIPPLPLILPNQNIVYDPLQKCEVIAKNFYTVCSQVTLLTSPLSPVVNDYIILDHPDEMIPSINTNFLTSYVVLNIIKSMSNKAFRPRQNYHQYVEK